MPEAEGALPYKKPSIDDTHYCAACKINVRVGLGGDYNWHQHELSNKHQAAIIPKRPKPVYGSIFDFFPRIYPRHVTNSDSTRHSNGHVRGTIEIIDIDAEAEKNNLLDVSPVIESATYVYASTNLVQLDQDGISSAAEFIHSKMQSEKYSPNTWLTHPLHLIPPPTYTPSDPRTKECLDWIFLVSSLNFSFWSEREGTNERFAIDWREGWNSPGPKQWDGYWSLLAAINRALEEGFPITTPEFYSSPDRCPDSLIEYIFRPSPSSRETIPLMSERIAVMREVGFILCSKFNGSYQGFLKDFQDRFNGRGTALDAVQMVVESFPSFRDELQYEGRTVHFWKRAQILIAETWAAFYPIPTSPDPHPFFPTGVSQLTMFADYRVPQILHTLRILTYPASVLDVLQSHTPILPGDPIELSIRSASILAVEALKHEIEKFGEGVPSVIIDFWLWDLAKRVEKGEDLGDIEKEDEVPAHRTRSIWY